MNAKSTNVDERTPTKFGGLAFGFHRSPFAVRRSFAVRSPFVRRRQRRRPCHHFCRRRCRRRRLSSFVFVVFVVIVCGLLLLLPLFVVVVVVVVIVVCRPPFHSFIHSLRCRQRRRHGYRWTRGLIPEWSRVNVVVVGHSVGLTRSPLVQFIQSSLSPLPSLSRHRYSNTSSVCYSRNVFRATCVSMLFVSGNARWGRGVLARTHCEFAKAVVVAGVDVASLSARLLPEPTRCGLGCENAQNQPPRKNNNH